MHALTRTSRLRVIAGILSTALVAAGTAALAQPARAASAPYAVSTISSFENPDGVVFAPGGKTAYVIDQQATVGGKYAMFVVSTATNTIAKTIVDSRLDEPVAEAINPSGTDVYVLNANGTVSVVSTAKNAVTAVIGTPDSLPSTIIRQAIAVSPDGKTAYVTHYSLGIVSVLNLTTGTVARTIAVSDPGALTLSPDGKDLYVVAGFGSNSPSVAVISTATDKVTGSITAPVYGEYYSLDVSPDGSRLYIVDNGGYVHVVDTATRAVTGNITGFSGEPEESAISADGSALYVADGSDVAVVNTSAGTVAHDIAIGPSVTSDEPLVTAVAVSPGGATVYAAGRQFYHGELAVIAAASATLTGFAPTVGRTPVAIAFSPSGQRAYVANDDSLKAAASVTVINTATGIATAVIQLPLYSGPDGVAVSPDGKTVYVADSLTAVQIVPGVYGAQVGHTVSVIDAATGTVTGTITVGNAPAGIAFSPDGKTAYVANDQDGTVSVIDVATASAVNTVNVGPDPVSLAVSPDGTSVYVGTTKGVSVISAATDSVTRTITGLPTSIGQGLAVALSPDGRTLYAGDDGVAVVNALTGKVTAVNSSVCAPNMAITPNGATLYVTCARQVQAVSTATDKVTATITSPIFGGIAGIAVRPDGKAIYAADKTNDSVHVLTPVAKPPAFTSKAAATFKVGARRSFTVKASGLPVPSLSETGRLPKGVTFRNNKNGTATIAGRPAAGTGRVYTLRLRAANGVGTATQKFRLVVDQAPKFTSRARVTFTYHKRAAFKIRTTGYPVARKITESGRLPKGLRFRNNKNGTATIAGRPAVKANKVYTLTIKARNGVAPAATFRLKLIVRK